MTKKYGLIGYPLGHTFSPKYFAKKFDRLQIDAEYLAYPIAEIAEIKKVLDFGVSGLNVTIPYKEKIIPFLDALDPQSEAIGAVNTVRIEDGRLTGYNTDVFGFKESLLLLNLPFTLEGDKALILGTGGASKAVCYVLKELGMQVDFASRTPDGNKRLQSYQSLSSGRLKEYSVIVNTTPLGMYPYETALPSIPIQEINENQLVYDLIYNPEKTLLLEKAEEQGAVIKNGAQMLVLQAEKSWEIWNS